MENDGDINFLRIKDQPVELMHISFHPMNKILIPDVVEINVDTGEVILLGKHSVNEAAKEFWEAVKIVVEEVCVR